MNRKGVSLIRLIKIEKGRLLMITVKQKQWRRLRDKTEERTLQSLTLRHGRK